jgi:1-acyl-sn-glycerol-3-phosphate acyltransferase
MDWTTAWHATRQWVPFSARTMTYATVSCVLGPLSAERRASLWAMKSWCRSSAQALGIRVECQGLEHVPPTGAFVYASNHQSLLDVLTLGSVLPGDFKWAAKRSLLRVPFLGWHLQLAGHIPVERGRGPEAAARVIQQMEAVLRDGKPVLVFPEGTRSDDALVRPFKRGGFAAAVRANVPVVPVALEGTASLMRPGDAYTKAGTVVIRVGKPILPPEQGDEAERVDALRTLAFDAVRALHRDAGGVVPDEPPAPLGRNRPG